MKQMVFSRQDVTYVFWLSASLLMLFCLCSCEPVQTQVPPHDPFYGQDQPAPTAPLSKQLEGAGQVLQEALTNPDARLRSVAVEIVSSTRQLRFLPTVRQLARDPAVPVRFAALLAIGDTGYTPAHQDLLQIFNEPQEDLNVKMAAAYALGRMGVREYPSFYIQQIRSTDQTVRANAALLIGKGGQQGGAIGELFWALQDAQSNDRVHMQAADSLARLGDERIMERLWTRLISSYVDDRIDGIRAMGHLNTRKALEAIQTMLDDPEPEVVLAAAEQLGMAGDIQAAGQVLTLVKRFAKPTRGDDPDQRLRVLTMSTAAIAAMGSPELTDYLDPWLKHDSPILRLAAARAIFKIQARSPAR